MAAVCYICLKKPASGGQLVCGDCALQHFGYSFGFEATEQPEKKPAPLPEAIYDLAPAAESDEEEDHDYRLSNEKKAIAEAQNKGFIVYRSTPQTLLLDLDCIGAILRFQAMIGMVEAKYGVRTVIGWHSKSSTSAAPRWHVMIVLVGGLPLMERLLLQSVLGSDPRREVLNLAKTLKGQAEPSLLFKPPSAKTVDNPKKEKPL